jgi:hypothetical protein
MLGIERPTTPRPIAPARARRKPPTPSKLPSAPPPPYEAPRASLLGSPLPATAQLIEFFAEPPAQPREDWVEQKARTDLRDLLVRADATIRERENGQPAGLTAPDRAGS